MWGELGMLQLHVGENAVLQCAVTMHSYALEKDRYSRIVLGRETKQSKNDKGYLKRV